MNESTLPTFHSTWINIIHAFLTIYTNCSRSVRVHNQNRLKAILRDIEGFDIPSDETTPDLPPAQHPLPVTLPMSHHTAVVTVCDLQKGIQAMDSIFPESARPSGEEHEPFSVPVNPIPEKMEALQTPCNHRPSVFFSLIKGKAHKAASKIPLSTATLDSLLTVIKTVVLFDKDVQNRRVSQWMNVTYTQFRRHGDKDEIATRKYIEHLFNF